MNTAIISLGSNVDPKPNIEKARNILYQKFETIGASHFVETEPVGFQDQNNFLNGCLKIKTGLDLEALVKELKQIESDLGRRPSLEKFGPRIIDLDIVVWNEKVVDQDFFERDYLKNSVLELIPNLQH